jgi:hypothetical protein
MIEIIFKVTSDGGQPSDSIVRIHDPVRSPPERPEPWTAVVEVLGGSYRTTGMDPLDAIECACRHAAITLRAYHADAVIEPSIEPRTTPPEPSTGA